MLDIFNLPRCTSADTNRPSPVAAASRRWPWRTATATWPKRILPNPLTPSVLCKAPKSREIRVVTSLYFPVLDTHARANGISCFPCQTTTRSFLRFSASPRLFFSRVLPASRLFLRARLRTCRQASEVTRWVPSFRKCCATSTALAATASTAATTTRSSTASTCFNKKPRAANTYHERCSCFVRETS